MGVRHQWQVVDENSLRKMRQIEGITLAKEGGIIFSRQKKQRQNSRKLITCGEIKRYQHRK